MTPDQICLVRSSWPILEAKADSLSTIFYAYLFSIDHGAARLFAHVDMGTQKAKLVQSLAVVVEALDDTDRLLPPLAALAKRHTRYGVELHHFHSVGEALILALGDTLGSAGTPDLLRAWTESYALVSSVMHRALILAAG